jgi:hypothetical protein
MSLLVDKTSNAYQKNDVAFKITIERLIDQIVIFFFDMFTQKWGRRIRTSDFRFMRRGPQPIELPIGNTLFFYGHLMNTYMIFKITPIRHSGKILKRIIKEIVISKAQQKKLGLNTFIVPSFDNFIFWYMSFNSYHRWYLNFWKR